MACSSKGSARESSSRWHIYCWQQGRLVTSAGDKPPRVLSNGRIVMESQQARWGEVTRRAFLGTAAGAAAGTYGLSLGLAAEVPSTFDGKDFQLRAPEPNARRGGVLRYGCPDTRGHFDVHQQGATILVSGCLYNSLRT